MIGAVQPACARAPKCRRKNKYREQKKDSRHLEPEDAAHSAKRLEKSADAPRHTAAGRAKRTSASCCAGSSCWCSAVWRSLRSRADALSCNAPCDAQTDAEYPSNRFRSHFDMMVTAAACTMLCTRMDAWRLPSAHSGSKVIQTHAAPERRVRGSTSWRYS